MATELRYRDLKPGDPAPWFHQRCTSNERYAFDTVAGRYVLMCFYGTAAAPVAAQRLSWVQRVRPMFDDTRLALFGVSIDPADEREKRTGESLPGIRQLWDADGRVSRLYGALPMREGEAQDAPEPAEAPAAVLSAEAPAQFRPLWLLLNPSLQVRAALPFASDGSDMPRLEALLTGLPPLALAAGIETQAPIIVVPEVFEPSLREALLQQYEQHGGEASGFMREQDGRTVGVMDSRHKVRRDHLVEDPALVALIQRRILGRLVPLVHRAHQFQATRMERYLVACYDAAEGAHFRAHRDNTTKGTAHRRFAVTINLNDDFDGGTLSFPEFGARRYKPPPGAALVFSCSMLHQVDVVTRGRRFAFLPFLYDEAAAALRQANKVFLDDGLRAG